MAVLLPTTRRLSGPPRRALERFGVPYRLGAGERQLIAEPIVGNVLDLFRLALDPAQADELLPSMLTSPLGGLDPGELRALRRAALLADRSLADHVRCRATPPPLPEANLDPAAEDEEAGPGRGGSALVLDPGLVARVEALCDLLERAQVWVAELDADACFWEVLRTAPALA